jgi:hypothetical protein
MDVEGAAKDPPRKDILPEDLQAGYFEPINAAHLSHLTESCVDDLIEKFSCVIGKAYQVEYENRMFAYKPHREAVSETRTIKRDPSWRPAPLPNTEKGMEEWNNQSLEYKEANFLRRPTTQEGKREVNTLGKSLGYEISMILPLVSLTPICPCPLLNTILCLQRMRSI